MLEFCSQFRFLHLRHHRQAILHLPTKFRPNPQSSNDVRSIFKNGGQGIAILFPVSVFVISLIREGRNLAAYQISAKYLNLRLIYYYFRFLKTDVRHVRILLPVPIFTFASSSACHSASAYQISSKSDHLRQSYDVISIFSRWRLSAILNFLKDNCRNPRSANEGLRSVLKFGLDQIYSFGDTAILML